MIRTSHDAPDTLDRADRWGEQAACARPEYRDRIDELWYAHATQTAAIEEAKTICNALCPVRAACLADALAREGGAALDRRHGVRGGLTDGERLGRHRRRKASA